MSQLAATSAAQVPDTTTSQPLLNERPSVRAVVMGSLLAIVLCAMNSYLTLSFGVIEEGPTIAALFFFSFFYLAKRKVTTHEMVIVATMGSAGGSLGFISNFFAAKAMTGTPYTFTEMLAFCVMTSLVGLAMVIPLRQMLILRDNLPWPGSRAVESVIRTLVQSGDPKQARLLLGTTVVLISVVLMNNDGGFGLLPAETHLFGLAAFGGAIAWSPFAIGGSYLMGFRTCVGFLVGAVALLVMAPHTATPAAPHKFFWPGLGFLVASGIVNLLRNWRAFAGLAKSFRGGSKSDDDDPVMSGRTWAIFTSIAVVMAIAVMTLMFGINLLIALVLIVVGGFVQNLIATRAAALTAFNPARVMGILMQGVTSALGGSSTTINLTGAGFAAGSNSQASVLTADMMYGRWLRVPARHQFWTQLLTVVPCALVSALAFQQINALKPLTLDSAMPAPVAKTWAASAQLFDGTTPLPEGALQALLIGAVIGIVYVLLERIPLFGKYAPESTGIGLGLVLSVSLGLSFFLGGFLMWIVLGRWLKLSEVSLTTVAVASIVAEGLGGVAKPLLTMAGLL